MIPNQTVVGVGHQLVLSHLIELWRDGTVDPSGNARAGFGQEKARNGKPKGLEYRFAALCLAHWAQLTRNPALESTARRVFEADLKMRASGSEIAWDGY